MGSAFYQKGQRRTSRKAARFASLSVIGCVQAWKTSDCPCYHATPQPCYPATMFPWSGGIRPLRQKIAKIEARLANSSKMNPYDDILCEKLHEQLKRIEALWWIDTFLNALTKPLRPYLRTKTSRPDLTQPRCTSEFQTIVKSTQHPRMFVLL